MKATMILFIVVALLVGVFIGVQFKTEIKCFFNLCWEGPRLRPNETPPHRCTPDKPCRIPALERDSDL